MTLINCSENCKFQHDGYCRLTHSAGVSNVKVNGCSYFQEKKQAKSNSSKRKGTAPIK